VRSGHGSRTRQAVSVSMPGPDSRRADVFLGSYVDLNELGKHRFGGLPSQSQSHTHSVIA
jgi:hypothetical protein